VVSNQNNSISILAGSLRPLTTVTVSSSANPSKVGQSITLTATVSPSDATGVVTFFNGKTVLGSNALVGGQASLSTRFTPGGAYTVTASYSGSASYAPATTDVLTQNVVGALTLSVT